MQRDVFSLRQTVRTIRVSSSPTEPDGLDGLDLDGHHQKNP